MSYSFKFDDIFEKSDIDNIKSMQTILKHHNNEGRVFINKLINKEIDPMKLFYLNLILYGIEDKGIYGNFKLLNDIDQKDILENLNNVLERFGFKVDVIMDCVESLKRDFRLYDNIEISFNDL